MGETEYTTILVPKEISAKLSRLAEAHRRSKTQEASWLVDKATEEEFGKTPKTETNAPTQPRAE